MPKPKSGKRTRKPSAAPASKRPYLKQADVPSGSLDDALRIPQAILDHHGGRPATPMQVAKALNMDPKGSQIRVLSGAAIAFGLIEGGAQAAYISITDLARRILRPKEENQDITAKREAVLKPRVFGEFLRKNDGCPFPRSDIAQNVLEELGVPRDKTEGVLEQIDACARSVGFIEEIKSKNYITLRGATPQPFQPPPAAFDEEAGQSSTEPTRVTVPPPIVQPRAPEMRAAIADDQRRRRVFITHGKNRDLVDPIRKLLDYGELEPVISVEGVSVSKPVPEKVLDDMRSCGAAIIHVDADRTIVDRDGSEHILLNPNVLIEVGAAMAFYGRRFILLVREGVKLPSNLQGLFEVRYTGVTLDAAATLMLLEAMKDIKNYGLPNETPGNES
jgi:predicted nucleotide-binding protein